MKADNVSIFDRAEDKNMNLDIPRKTSLIDFQVNNFDLNGYHPFKGCYPYGLQTSCNGNLISERLYNKKRWGIEVVKRHVGRMLN